jgi:hypothetical protein
MNFPFVVLPKYCDPGFQYTPERVFTHTSFAVTFGALVVGHVSITTFGASNGLPVATTGGLAPVNL